MDDVETDILNNKVKNIFVNKITNGFIIMPVVVGVKWNDFNNFYFPRKAGLVAGLKNAGTNFSLSPGLGYLININGKQKIDVGLKLMGVLPVASIPKIHFLKKAGIDFYQ